MNNPHFYFKNQLFALPYHACLKYPITNDISAFAMMTSQSFINLPYSIPYTIQNEIVNQFNIKNISLVDNSFRFINPIILGENSIISKFIEISDNCNHAPNFIKKQYFKNQDLNYLITDANIAFEKSLARLDLNNNLLVVEEIFYKNPINAQIPSFKIKNVNVNLQQLAQYSSNEEIIKNKLSNSDLYHFVTNFHQNKTIHGKSIFSTNHLFFEASDALKKPLHKL